jgi:phosphoglycerol transferase MdoB-like AlkP superfamily enzyme
MLFKSSSFVAWYTAATCLALFVGAVDGPIAAYLVYSFPTKVRYTGVSVCYSLGAALCGGLSPLIITLLQGESQLPMLQIYIMISVIIFLLAVFILRPRVNNYAFVT